MSMAKMEMGGQENESAQRQQCWLKLSSTLDTVHEEVKLWRDVSDVSDVRKQSWLKAADSLLRKRLEATD